MQDTLVRRARDFAVERHGAQIRKDRGGHPYIFHCAEVAALAHLSGASPETVAAAWLHDTVEDCPPTDLAEIAAAFGPEVAALVGEVTDDKSLPAETRKRLQIETAPAISPAAAVVRICDKISNVRSVGVTPPPHWPLDRRLAYVAWSEAVVGRLPPVPQPLGEEFRRAADATRAIILAVGAL